MAEMLQLVKDFKRDWIVILLNVVKKGKRFKMYKLTNAINTIIQNCMDYGYSDEKGG